MKKQLKDAKYKLVTAVLEACEPEKCSKAEAAEFLSEVIDDLAASLEAIEEEMKGE